MMLTSKKSKILAAPMLSLLVFSGAFSLSAHSSALFSSVAGIKDTVRASQGLKTDDSVYRSDECNSWEELRQDVIFHADVMTPRPLNKKEAKHKVFKNVGLIGYEIDGKPDSRTGVIVGPNCDFLVTAAHEFYEDGKLIASNFKFYADYPRVNVVEPKSVHPLTRDTITGQNENKDMVAIKLSKPAFDKKNCVETPVIADAKSAPNAGEDVIAVGYYAPAKPGEEKLYESEIREKLITYCSKYEGNKGDLIDSTLGVFPHDCPERKGASGMPLFKMVDGRPYLVGLNLGELYMPSRQRKDGKDVFDKKKSVNRGLVIQSQMKEWFRMIGVEMYENETEMVGL